MDELPWITIFGHERGDLPMVFTSDQKSLFTVTNVLFYFFYTLLCSEHTILQ